MIAYLEFPCLEGFTAEAGYRGLSTVGLVEVSRRREIFEQHAFRITGFDKDGGLILRCGLPFYHGFQLDRSTSQRELEKYGEAKEKVEGGVRRQLEALGLHAAEAEHRLQR